MSTLTTNVNLLKMKDSFIFDIKGNTKTMECICIPIKGNNFYVDKEKKIVSLDLQHVETPGSDYGSHLVKQNIKKEVYNNMSEEERIALPILGNTKTWGSRPSEPQASPSPQPEVKEDFTEDDDLPF